MNTINLELNISLFSFGFFLTPYLQVSVSKARAIIVIAEDGNADQVSGLVSVSYDT